MSSEEKLKVIGYCRESTREQAKYGFNLDDQEKKILKYVDVYFTEGSYKLTMMREEGASAKSLNRPKMNEIMALVRKGKVDTIIIHNLDRLTRQVRDLTILLEEFDKHDVSLISITEKIDTKSPMGRFFIYMIVLIAQWEWETISSRSIRGIEESARQGNYALPGAPLGYRRNPENQHKLIIEPEEAAVIKRIFESMAYKQYSAKMLASEFNKDKVLSRKWTDDKITKILENKIYYGTFERFGVEYPDHTDPIITKELYDIANQNLQKKWHSSRNKYLYKKLVICKQCGKTMACSSSKPSSGITHLYYRCTTCKKHVAESRITAEYQETFESMMKESQYQEEMAKILNTDPDMYTALSIIPYSVIMSGQLNDQILGKFNPDSVTLKVFAQTIQVIRASLKRRTFDRMSFPDKRKFLIDSVQSISYDYEKDELSMEFRSE